MTHFQLADRCAALPQTFTQSIRCGESFLLVMPFLFRRFRRQLSTKIYVAAQFPSSAASALCPVGVARVSRLIGKSDTTAKSQGWQVPSSPHRPSSHSLREYRRRMLADSAPLESRRQHDSPQPVRKTRNAIPETRNATPSGVAFRCPALVTGLPSNCGRWLFPSRLLQAFRPVSPCRSRFVGGWLLPGPAILWAGRISPAAGTSLAPSI
jgi:hypothetical protein